MSVDFGDLLRGLARQRGVRASLVVEERAGLVVESIVHVGIDADALAALATLLHRHIFGAAGAARIGAPRFMQLEAACGTVCVAGRGELLLVALGDKGANFGLLRLEMLRGCDVLS